ncbi:MAG: beta-mannosidase, partial [Bacteroidota bacterium]|nr:beta-mannosidase [Bacteroidota bacterium]
SMRHYIRQVYSRGGVITLSWHLNNPLTGKTAWNPAPGTVTSILPGGEAHERYQQWLDKVADFILSLKTKNGTPIPVILRLFHECNGGWFWWGKGYRSPGEFKNLWHYTVSYLRDHRHLHQVLYAYNTDKFFSREAYLLQYPGNSWVDIMGVDIYQSHQGEAGNKEFIGQTDSMLTLLDQIALEKNKIPALTEFGYNLLPDSAWWTRVFWKALAHHRISYALAWRNAGKENGGHEEFYVPFKGQESARDFLKLYHQPGIIFQKKVTQAHLYQ